MPDYILLTLFIMSLFLPMLVVVFGVTFVRVPARFPIILLGVVIAIGVNVLLKGYAEYNHPALFFLYVMYVIANVVCSLTILDYGTELDKERGWSVRP